jgi:hypothetical protein
MMLVTDGVAPPPERTFRGWPTRRPLNDFKRRYSTTILPCIHGWMAQR